MDMRGHGKTHTSNDANLSADVLAQWVDDERDDPGVVGSTENQYLWLKIYHSKIITTIINKNDNKKESA